MLCSNNRYIKYFLTVFIYFLWSITYFLPKSFGYCSIWAIFLHELCLNEQNKHKLAFYHSIFIHDHDSSHDSEAGNITAIAQYTRQYAFHLICILRDDTKMHFHETGRSITIYLPTLSQQSKCILLSARVIKYSGSLLISSPDCSAPILPQHFQDSPERTGIKLSKVSFLLYVIWNTHSKYCSTAHAHSPPSTTFGSRSGPGPHRDPADSQRDQLCLTQSGRTDEVKKVKTF